MPGSLTTVNDLKSSKDDLNTSLKPNYADRQSNNNSILLTNFKTKKFQDNSQQKDFLYNDSSSDSYNLHQNIPDSSKNEYEVNNVSSSDLYNLHRSASNPLVKSNNINNNTANIIEEDHDAEFVQLKQNKDIKENHLFINGILTPYEYAVEVGKQLLKDKPGNTYVLYNGTTGSFLNDGSRALIGRVSDEWGNYVEKSVESLITFIKNKLNTNEEINLYGHSQGAIIIQNALGLLKEQLTESDFEKLKSNLKINLYGTASYGNMDEFNVKSYVNDGDIVTPLLAGPKYDNIREIHRSGSHDISDYIREIHKSKKEKIGKYITAMINIGKQKINEFFVNVLQHWKNLLFNRTTVTENTDSKVNTNCV